LQFIYSSTHFGNQDALLWRDEHVMEGFWLPPLPPETFHHIPLVEAEG
jgi:hypothetical protein